ncbi:hypothetical protein J14TS2_23980 [Bacillus sp. J14TS2]|uniref:Ger(x)C family spore germination protein n=1 Tax=Bacillus sp. J14TS2 TaxID=2807188 RepID=UPI001B2855D9|nr:Ger(x)C family spore germination protein [Bacillus sp. J14TS2]GIN71923.1 hypothetical protein J14TS2_23980 [Bacillus sp. J14TS2]
MKRLLKKYMVLILSVLFFTSLLSSCAFKDIDKRIFVQGISIDYTGKEDKPYKITLKLAIPTGSLKEAEGNKYGYLSREDSSLAGAIRFLKTYADKEPDFGHGKIILLGEELLEHNIEDVMDFFYRRRDIQMISWVAVGNPTAEDVLKTEPVSEMAASNLLTNLFSKNGVESAYTISTFLFEMKREFSEPGIDPILPVIQTNKEKSKVKVNKSVVLKNNHNDLHLSSKYTQSFNVLTNRINKYDLRVREEDVHFLVAIDSIKVKYKIDTSEEIPVIKMNVKQAGIIEESFEEMSASQLDHYGDLASKAAKKNIVSFLKLLQEEDADPLGFGLRYRATRIHNRDTYEEWKELYPKVKFDVRVKTAIKSTGTIE